MKIKDDDDEGGGDDDRGVNHDKKKVDVLSPEK